MDSVVTPVAIALGSNLGNRAAHLDWGGSRLREFIDGLIVSAYIESAPVDVPKNFPQHAFLNAAAIGHTELAPRALLERLHAIEEERGRVRTLPNEPRVLDLDLILYGNLAINEADLVIPHPRFRARAFVLTPLAELAPSWIDPVSGQTIAALAKAIATDA